MIDSSRHDEAEAGSVAGSAVAAAAGVGASGGGQPAVNSAEADAAAEVAAGPSGAGSAELSAVLSAELSTVRLFVLPAVNSRLALAHADAARGECALEVHLLAMRGGEGGREREQHLPLLRFEFKFPLGYPRTARPLIAALSALAGEEGRGQPGSLALRVLPDTRMLSAARGWAVVSASQLPAAYCLTVSARCPC
ncbi:hypothetical protein T492DRAFT_1051598 [Pavlovales sp. CCMP2436]|nr:hypothetical protein T492DRAFT_1051598 [Pavlovales sp. CCMP2436]